MTLDTLWPQLWPSLILCGAPLFLAWLADQVFQSRAAVRSLRLRAALLATIALAILPLLPLQLPRPSWLPAPIVTRPVAVSAPVVAPQSLPAEIETVPPLLPAEMRAVETQTPQIEAASPRKHFQRDSSVNWPQIAMGIWLLGTLVLLSWSAGCHAHIARLRGRSQVLAEGKLFDAATEIARDWRMNAPRLLHTPTINSPFAIGVWRRAICWPAHFQSDNSESWRAILRHEMAHVRRHDCAWNACAQIVRALLWPQPLLWWACRAIRRNAEDVCDEAALENCAPTIYARGLLDLSQNAAASTCSATRAASAGALPSQPELSRRVAAILRPGARDAWRVGWRTRVATVAALSLMIGFGALLTSAPAQESKTATEVSGAVKIDLSTPQATLDTFVAAVKAGDARALVACVETKNSAEDLEEMANQLRPWQDKLSVSSWNIKIKGDTAQAQAKIEFSGVPSATDKYQSESRLKLVKNARGWQINSEKNAGGRNDLLAPTAQTIADPEVARLHQWARDHPTDAVLSGQVLTSSGKPAANASVRLQISAFSRQIFGKPQSSFIFLAQPKSMGKMQSARVVADKNGRYRMEGLTEALYLVSAFWPATPAEKNPQPFDLEFNARELAASQQVQTQKSQNTQAPILKTQPTAQINVLTVDARDGQPLQGASYFVDNGHSSGTGSIRVSRASGEDGHAVLNVPIGKISLGLGSNIYEKGVSGTTTSRGNYLTNNQATVQLEDRPPIPYASTTSFTIATGQTRRVTVRLTPLADLRKTKPRTLPPPRLRPPAEGKGTGILTGRVQNSDGSAAPNVQVTARMQQTARWDLMRSEGLGNVVFDTKELQDRYDKISPLLSQSARTDSKGNFRVSGLMTAPYDLVTGQPDSFGESSTNGKVSVAEIGVWAHQDQTTQRAQPIILQTGALIRGRITDAQNGAGIGGVTLGCYGPHRPRSSEGVAGTTTKPDGSFSLRVPAGRNEIYLAGPSNYEVGTQIRVAATGQEYNGYVLTLPSQRFYQGSGYKYQLDGNTRTENRKTSMLEVTALNGQNHTLNFQLQRLKLAK